MLLRKLFLSCHVFFVYLLSPSHLFADTLRLAVCVLTSSHHKAACNKVSSGRKPPPRGGEPHFSGFNPPPPPKNFFFWFFFFFSFFSRFFRKNFSPQIKNNATIRYFLSADLTNHKSIIKEQNFALQEPDYLCKRQLALWSINTIPEIALKRRYFKSETYRHCQPKNWHLYGKSQAKKALRSLSIWTTLKTKIVQAENIRGRRIRVCVFAKCWNRFLLLYHRVLAEQKKRAI